VGVGGSEPAVFMVASGNGSNVWLSNGVSVLGTDDKDPSSLIPVPLTIPVAWIGALTFLGVGCGCSILSSLFASRGRNAAHRSGVLELGVAWSGIPQCNSGGSATTGRLVFVRQDERKLFAAEFF